MFRSWIRQSIITDISKILSKVEVYRPFFTLFKTVFSPLKRHQRFHSWLCWLTSTLRCFSPTSCFFDRALARHLKHSIFVHFQKYAIRKIGFNKPRFAISTATPINPTGFHGVFAKWITVDEQFLCVTIWKIIDQMPLSIPIFHWKYTKQNILIWLNKKSDQFKVFAKQI